MKIKNISNQPLTIPFKSKQGKGVIITLNPGQIVFCESHTDKNQQVRVFLKKKKIEISEDDKPQNGQYYHAYGVLPHDEVVKLMQHTAHTLDLDEEDDEVEPSESIPSDLEIKESEEEVEDIDDTKQEGQIKNKGGRPKGSKNKKKSGRPKKKKPIGRPSKNKNNKTESSKEENSNNDTI